jgi:ribosome modulation factor
VPKPLPPWGPSAKICTSACRHGLCPRMNANFAVRSFVCRWANATADSATGGYPAEALGSRTGRSHRRWAQAGISWRYHGLCPWGSIVTPEEIIPTRREGGRPRGIIKEHLTEDKISAIPILRELLTSEQK